MARSPDPWHAGDGMNEGVILGGDGRAIATVHHHNMPLEEHVDNLKLIENAPNLLRVLRLVIETNPDRLIGTDIKETVREAIIKAGGA